ncbi:hypothetical protein C2869_12115 [Saccharobesus litoralis]|uniref:YdhG-like domain-containing protein n=1 Tax=Saccharobesus litoralis TaxID=2172099 RepID=A0A2S0VSH8_9ALTE|nr:DUF1801 domain-containing protein [Saccharobesus litoralis]AWB67132.1 hypothetical protein C2869_12115 [Saccharobesus litoralis]
MKIAATTVEEYIAQVPPERQAAFQQLRQVILSNIPHGFVEQINYGMLGYVVPHTLYPAGYHCDPKLPLPFTNIANQKNFIGFYHMGLYAKPELHAWFVEQYAKYSDVKLDMGKSCVRFKKVEKIPFTLIADLMQKMTVDEWIQLYENRNKG